MIKKIYTIKKSSREHKKYMAVFFDGRKTIHFGDNRYGQFKDVTQLKLYKNLDNNDPIRKKAYYARFGNDAKIYSAQWFSDKFLW